MEESLRRYPSGRTEHLPSIQLVQRSRANRHNTQHATSMHDKPTTICPRSNGRHVLIRQNPDGPHWNGSHDTHQTRSTPHVGIPRHPSMVLRTSTPTLLLHQGRHRGRIRPSHRHIQIPTPLPSRHTHFQHRQNSTGNTTLDPNTQRSTRYTARRTTSHPAPQRPHHRHVHSPHRTLTNQRTGTRKCRDIPCTTSSSRCR